MTDPYAQMRAHLDEGGRLSPEQRLMVEKVEQAAHPTVEGLKAWLECQDPSTSFKYHDIYDCLLARYMLGVTNKSWFVGGYTLRRADEIIPIPNDLTDVARVPEETYEAALDKCKEVLK